MEFLSKLKLASNKVSIGESTGNLILPTPEGNDLNLLAVDSEGILNGDGIVFLDNSLCYATIVAKDGVNQFKIYQTEYETCSNVASISNSNFSAFQFYCFTNPDNGLSDCTQSTFTLSGEGVFGVAVTSNDSTQMFCQYQVLLTVKGLEFRSGHGHGDELCSTLYDLDSIRHDNNYFHFPEKSGTIALVEDLPDTSEFVKNGTDSLCLNSLLQVGLNSSSHTQLGAGCISIKYDGKCVFSALDHGAYFWVLPSYKGSDKIVISESGSDYDDPGCSGCSGCSTNQNLNPIFVTDEAVIGYVNKKVDGVIRQGDNSLESDLWLGTNGGKYDVIVGCGDRRIKLGDKGIELIEGIGKQEGVLASVGWGSFCSVNVFTDVLEGSSRDYINLNSPILYPEAPTEYDHLVNKKYVDDQISSKLGTVFTYKGNKEYGKLPTTGNKVGDVYNLTSASGDYKVGDNVVWDGSSWDKLASTVDTSAFLDKNYTDIQTIKSSGIDFNGCIDVANEITTRHLTARGDVKIDGNLEVSGCCTVIRGTLDVYEYTNFYCRVHFDDLGLSVKGDSNFIDYRIKFYGCSATSPESYYALFNRCVTTNFDGPVNFHKTVSINELAVQELSIENLSVGEEITVNNVPVIGSIEALQKKTGVFTQVLPAKNLTSGIAEFSVVFNTDSSKTVLAPPNVVVTDITGSREKYVLVTTEWDENTVYLKFEENVPANAYKVYITNIQLA